jgi:hypothetical protein
MDLVYLLVLPNFTLVSLNLEYQRFYEKRVFLLDSVLIFFYGFETMVIRISLIFVSAIHLLASPSIFFASQSYAAMVGKKKKNSHLPPLQHNSLPLKSIFLAGQYAFQLEMYSILIVI